MLKNIKMTKTILPSNADIALAKQASRILSAHYLSSSTRILIKNGKKEEKIQLPMKSLHLLVEILMQMAEGNAVAVVPIHHELSTQEAANLLNVSRPYFVNLLKTSKIPYRKVGTKRRILTQDVLTYKMKEDQARLKILVELTAESQKLGFYDE